MNAHAAVIGTVFIDCKGFSQDHYRPAGRNLGKIKFIHGGVGRNVAENLASLGIPASFVSTVDANGLGKEVAERLRGSSVITGYLYEAEAAGMGMWLAILDENGSLAGSISQMPDLNLLEHIIENQGEEIIGQASHVILELDLNAVISKKVMQLAQKHGKPVYGLPGNLDVIMQDQEMLSRLACFICNNYEAERLLEIDLTGRTPQQIQEALVRFVGSKGLQAMVITLGEHGSVYCDAASKETGFQSVFPVQAVDSSGAGDAFFSGTVMGLIQGLPLGKAVICGTKVAGWIIESTENTCRELKQKITEDAVLASLFNSES